MTHDHTPEDHEPDHAESPTAHLLAELQLFGHRPFEGEPDPRPLPEDHLVRAAVADTFDAFTTALQDRRSRRIKPRWCWSIDCGTQAQASNSGWADEQSRGSAALAGRRSLEFVAIDPA